MSRFFIFLIYHPFLSLPCWGGARHRRVQTRPRTRFRLSNLKHDYVHPCLNSNRYRRAAAPDRVKHVIILLKRKNLAVFVRSLSALRGNASNSGPERHAVFTGNRRVSRFLVRRQTMSSSSFVSATIVSVGRRRYLENFFCIFQNDDVSVQFTSRELSV